MPLQLPKKIKFYWSSHQITTLFLKEVDLNFQRAYAIIDFKSMLDVSLLFHCSKVFYYKLFMQEVSTGPCIFFYFICGGRLKGPFTYLGNLRVNY